MLTPGSDSAYVELSFQENGLNGLIVKTISKKPKKGKIANDPNLRQLPDLEPDQWRIGYFLKEEEIADFLSRTPSSTGSDVSPFWY